MSKVSLPISYLWKSPKLENMSTLETSATTTTTTVAATTTRTTTT